MKKRWIIIAVILLISILIGVYCYSRDNIRFKISYEFINRIELTNGKKIKVNIPIDNRVKYINEKELLDLLKGKTGVLYMGYPTCPWCRNSVPILIDSIRENKIDTLYYVDIHKVKFNKIKDELYEILDTYLREDDDGNKVIAVPDVYVIKDGKILSHHRGTVDSYKNPYKGMNSLEKEELKEIYNNMIKEIK